MNYATVKKNFDKAILKALNVDQFDFTLLHFKLVFLDKNRGLESSKDNWMKAIHRNIDIITNFFEYDEAIRLRSAGDSHYPLWANMTMIYGGNIEIKCSCRFRHIKTFHNQEGGVPPFENKI